MNRVLVVRSIIVVLAIAAIVLFIVGRRKPTEGPAAPADAFALSCTTFADGEPIPVGYTCDGADASPPLEWTNAPAGTQTFALIMEDPDAPARTFTHWLVADIPAQTTSLPEDVPKQGFVSVPTTVVQGMNSFRKVGYGGPCPPAGDKPHRYIFTVYAVDTKCELPEQFNRLQLRAAMKGHVLAEATLTGTYQRQ